LKLYELFLEAITSYPYEEKKSNQHIVNALINMFFLLDNDYWNKQFITALETTDNFINFKFKFYNLLRNNKDNVLVNNAIWELLNLNSSAINHAFKFIHYFYINVDNKEQIFLEENLEDILGIYFYDFE